MYKGIISDIIIAYMVIIFCLSIHCTHAVHCGHLQHNYHAWCWSNGNALNLYCGGNRFDAGYLVRGLPAGKCRDRTLIRSGLLITNLFFQFINYRYCSHQILFGWSIKKRRMSLAGHVSRRVGHQRCYRVLVGNLRKRA